jgi:Kef-type K+ transport system membrane component KefB
MEIQDFFWIFALILVSAKIMAQLFNNVGIPAVLGELAAGLVLGPSLLGWIEPNQTLEVLAEIGIVLLIFEVGQETDILKLKEVGGNALIVALAGAFLPFGLGYALSHWVFGYSVIVSLFIGGMLTATSIGITVRVLKDIKQDKAMFSQVVLGAAVLDDIMGVIFLVVIYDFAVQGSVSLLSTAKVLFFMLVFMALAPLAALVLSKLLQVVEQKFAPPGFLAPVYVSLLLIFAWFSHHMGVPEILGSFAAGIAMSKRFFVPICGRCNLAPSFIHRVENSMEPIIYLFTPVFFVMIGLSMDLNVIDYTSAEFWIVGPSITALAIVTKMAGGYLTRGTSFTEKTLTGISMVPRGEVGLVFAKIGLLQGIFTQDIFAMSIFVIIVTTLLPPFALKWVGRRGAHAVTPAESIEEVEVRQMG